MQRIKFGWNAFKNVAIIFSFIVNVVLVLVLVVLGSQLLQIKNGIAEPLIDGLHASFVGLDKATIDRVIPVRDEIPVQFTLPLEQNTNVVLTGPVPLQVAAQFALPGGGGNINGTVTIQLPQGLVLPVSLDMDVPVDTTIPVSLDVRAVIPLEETQLHDPFENLRRLLDPYVRALDNLPDDAAGGWAFLSQVLTGQGADLLAPTDGSQYPWPGFSITAGEGYIWPFDTPAQPGQSTGTTPGGLEPWDLAPGAPDGIYIPYGVIGPAGIVPAGSELVDPVTSPHMGTAIEPLESPEEASPQEAPQPTASPPEGDLGILPVSPPQ